MALIDAAGGSVDPGSFINYESRNKVLPLLLRMFQGLHTGDFEIKRTSDGITFSNSGNIITNVANYTGDYMNDGLDPITPTKEKIAGSLANHGAQVYIGPRGKTYADVDYWEVCFFVSGTVQELISNFTMQIWVSCNGGWNDISSATAMPTPRVAGDPVKRIDTNSFGASGGDAVEVLNGFVTSGETSAPGAGFTIHLKGADTVLFSLRIDWVQHDTLDRLSADANKRDLYHPTITVEGWGGNDVCVSETMALATSIDSPIGNVGLGACTRFGNGLTTVCVAVPWAVRGFIPNNGNVSSSRIGKNSISGNEPLNPPCYIRPGGIGAERGSGQKGVGTHFWFAGEAHTFGDTPYVTNPGDRPFFVCRDVVFRNAGKKIYR